MTSSCTERTRPGVSSDSSNKLTLAKNKKSFKELILCHFLLSEQLRHGHEVEGPTKEQTVLRLDGHGRATNHGA
jgi:hypothetical protein